MNLKESFGILQRIGKSLTLPVALLPAAGLLMGIGILLQNVDMVENIPMLSNNNIQLVADIMSSSGNIIFTNLPLIFAVGVAIGMSKGEGVSALAAIIGFLIMNVTIGKLLGVTQADIGNNIIYNNVLGIPTIQTGVFGGILIGLISAYIYQKFYDIKLPEFLGFFSGKRSVPIITAVAGLLIGVLMAGIWPPIQNFLLVFSRRIINSNEALSSLIFGIVERALIPFGLHHIWYTPFWYQFGEYTNAAGQLIIGDQSIFFEQLKDGVELTAGTFMTGKYPFMMFGLPAAALAMYHEADEDNKKKVLGILFSAALTSFLTGITEPIEFMFLFVAPALFAIHCIFAGLSFMIMEILKIRIGVTFSGGLIDFILLGVLPNKSNWGLLIIVGLIFAITYYIGFRIIIRKLNLKTPGRERDDNEIKIDFSEGELAKKVIMALGGKENIKYLDACITRIRITVRDLNLVNRSRIKSLGSADLMIIGDNIQAIFGPNSDILKEQIRDIIEGRQIKVKKKKKIDDIKKGRVLEGNIMIPVSGKLMRIEETPDEIFSMKLIGDGFSINPVDNILIAPIDGKVFNISPTNHSITIRGNDGYDIFIHIGIDSINLKGEGFKKLVNEGDIILQGDELIEFPLELMKEKIKSPIIPIIFKGLTKEKYIYFRNEGFVIAGDISKVKIHQKK
ncbi:glucose-specific PTS transporter subunit IIBC [Clostridium sp.]|uniref:glucose-specific PTS transporter subunit IIBC n=1 Tax=Clostridium sp. TaxID=1506 RepID=UPI002612AEB3|nr:glucose-specific PTS transporter subunit IIBC [Clostridium sp.]